MLIKYIKGIYRIYKVFDSASRKANATADQTDRKMRALMEGPAFAAAPRSCWWHPNTAVMRAPLTLSGVINLQSDKTSIRFGKTKKMKKNQFFF